MAEKRFLSAADVSEIMGCSASKSYSIIRQLNEELEKKSFIVLRGKVSAKYFYERVYGSAEAAHV